MILAVYSAEKNPAQRDNKWLARAYDFAQRDYEHTWGHGPDRTQRAET